MELPVNLVALGSGLSMGYLGNSHYGLEDIAVMRTIPNLSIHSPSDCLELREIVSDISENDRGPSYIRLTGTPGMPSANDETYHYEYGIPGQLSEGGDVLIVAIGSMVAQSKIAVEKLRQVGISAELMNLQTIKPAPQELLNKIMVFDYIVSVEEHSIIGGLYATIAEHVVASGVGKKILPIALPDNFGPTGTYTYLLDYYGLTGVKIAERIKTFLMK